MDFLDKLNLRRAPNLSEQVADFIADEIEKGSLQPGEPLPSEAEFSERFKVSRTVIREALGRLKYDGLLVSKRGSKSVVAERGKQRVFRLERLEVTDLTQVRSLYEFRAILETQAGVLAAKRRTQENLEIMARCIEVMDEAVINTLDGTDANTDFHMEIVKASGNPYLEDFMHFFGGKVWDLIQADRNLSGYRGLPPGVQEEHRKIHKAISEGDSEKARDEILNHLKNAAKRRGLAIFES